MNFYYKFETYLQMAVILIAACSLRISITALRRSGRAGGGGGVGAELKLGASSNLS